jgi:hypothetical protein
MSDDYREMQTFNLLQKTVKYYFTSNLSLGLKWYVG